MQPGTRKPDFGVWECGDFHIGDKRLREDRVWLAPALETDFELKATGRPWL